ncbi:integrase (plasmid) [Cupriavidus sp. USMAA2-4]|uniref:tyrosine-type recombinase/integrase n=1 Tax=Cupriavidus sp. USMAA2-4 TaxID=876364 RepID=UPI0008A6AB05|nr:tyrosine-type recombinase/integrase [Cupriavidus sp. USMAA2-4]AOY97766.1 integrase [Cupriavidus sp. USMAA2-4]
MDAIHTIWLTKPVTAYADWQAREAAGADQRPFSARSIVQHQAMFEAFLRHLQTAGVSVATFGSDHVAAFWETPEAAGHSLSTRTRYLQLLDRLGRHLVFSGVRADNPAAVFMQQAAWPTSDPEPVYLDEEADGRLQAWTCPGVADDFLAVRNKAVVAMFLGAGITVAEGRAAVAADLHPEAASPYLRVPAHGSRDTRTVPLAAFSVTPLSSWLARRATLPIAGDLLFSAAGGEPVAVMTFGRIVRAALSAIGVSAPDMSPRILRNTFARRALMAGHDRHDLSRLLGLASNRTVDRLTATTSAEAGPDSPPAR